MEDVSIFQELVDTWEIWVFLFGLAFWFNHNLRDTRDRQEKIIDTVNSGIGKLSEEHKIHDNTLVATVNRVENKLDDLAKDIGVFLALNEPAREQVDEMHRKLHNGLSDSITDIKTITNAIRDDQLKKE